MITNAPSPRGTFFELFSIDIRSLAVLRIGLALVSLFYVAELFPDAELFLTRSGILPVELSRQLLNEHPNRYWSIYWLADSVPFCKMLLGFHLIVAIGLLIGFQTRFMLIACLLLTWSLEIRNPLQQDAGLNLLRLLLLWSVFLPLGRIWSIDSTLRGATFSRTMNWQIANVASVAIIFQSLAWLLLLAISLWLQTMSVTDLFWRDINLSFIGIWIANHPKLTWGLGFLVFFLLTLIPASMFVPRFSEFFRGTGLAVFLLAQLSIIFLFNLGYYPWVAIVSALIFIPGHSWNNLLGEPNNYENETKAQRQAARKFSMVHLPQIFCAALVLLVLVTNLMHWQLISFGKLANQRVSQLSQLTMASPGWNSQLPLSNHPDQKRLRPWFAYPGRLMNGQYVDLLNHHHLDVEEKPLVVADSFPNERWRRFHLSLWEKKPSEKLRRQISANLLNRMVVKWNAHPLGDSGPITSARLVCVEEALRQGHVIEVDKQTWAEQ